MNYFTKSTLIADKSKYPVYIMRFSLLAGILLRLFYVLYTPYTVRQNDIGYIGSDYGHISYITYLLDGGSLNFDFNPITRFQFYQPPVHYILSSLFIFLNRLFGFSLEQSFENLQFLILFYAILFLVACYMIFKELGLKGYGLAVAFSLICFSPSFIIQSGCINNDMLTLLFSTFAILFAIKWYHRPTTINIIKIGIFIALAMLTKLSGVLVAPAVAILFLYKLLSDRQNYKKYLLQFIIFGIITIPLGLLWITFLKIKYQIPINYVPKVSNDSGLYVGNFSMIDRLFSFSHGPLQNVFLNLSGEYIDYNIFAGMIKCALFGEFTLAGKGTILRTYCILLMVFALITIVAMIVGIFHSFISKHSSLSRHFRLFLLSLLLTCLFMYIRFCFAYPHTCSMNFRYISIIILPCAAALGFLYNDYQLAKSSFHQNFVYAMNLIIPLFCFTSLLVYLLLGISS
jgi:4-amino-4-deoxy-L-arabinose transferase-like glycosyltransferase